MQDTGIPLNSLFSQSVPPTNGGGENNMISIIEGSDDEESSDEEDSVDSDDDDKDEGNGEAMDFPIESIDEDEDQSKIVVSDTEDVQMHGQTPSTIDTTNNLNKMTLANLKSYAIENGLVESSSKIKKSDLIDLIQTAR